MGKDIRLTTVDNPYNPFTEYSEWFSYDMRKGYHTSERLASIAKTSNALSRAENNAIIDEACDELIKYGALTKDGTIIEFKKVYRN